ncbi:UNVERIFIED_CONTAM: hypothetical protein Slati_2945500 [Sesamum latifolium]|uniref:Uncharacterized protein n=1 Tax=Sesamum latifolium TaxID=2727402 RepID=A0AAW2VE42_9LAMI
MPLSLAMHAHIICLRPLRTPNLPFALFLRAAGGAPPVLAPVLAVAVTAVLLPFFLYQRLAPLPFDLEVEASPTNTPAQTCGSLPRIGPAY